jgi:hypothetical protein
MTSEQQMVLFTLMGFLGLGAGSIVLSLVTIFSWGNRSFALIPFGVDYRTGSVYVFRFGSLGDLPNRNGSAGAFDCAGAG